MAQYWTDFTDLTFPDDFSSSGGAVDQYVVEDTADQDSPGGKLLRPIITTASWCSIDPWGTIDPSADCEVRALMMQTGTSATNGAGPAFNIGGIGTSRRGIGSVLRVTSGRVRSASGMLSSGTLNTFLLLETIGTGELCWVSIERKNGVVTSRWHTYPDRDLIREYEWGPSAVTTTGIGIISQNNTAHIYALSAGTDGDPAPFDSGSEPPRRRRCPLLLAPR